MGQQPIQQPGLTGYHTVIPEAQQQRILDQAKARVAAQERSAMFTDKMVQPGTPGMGYGSPGMMAARPNQQQKPQTPLGQRGPNGTPASAFVPPQKVTPVPVPVIPGAQPQQQAQPQPQSQPQLQPQQPQQQQQQPAPQQQSPQPAPES